MEAGGGGAHWAVGRPGWLADQAKLPTAFSFRPGVDTWGPWSLGRGITSDKSV